MGKSAGLRSGTRYAFSRNFREKGMIRLSTYLRQYKSVPIPVENDVERLAGKNGGMGEERGRHVRRDGI